LVVVTKLVTVLELEEDELEESPLLPPQENKPRDANVARAIRANCFLVGLKFMSTPFK
jgi:hypothetical protein